jgi:hypothetical protein
MDINQNKQKIDASSKKIGTLGSEYIRAKDEVSARKVLVKMFSESSIQNLLLAEQISQLDKVLKGMK